MATQRLFFALWPDSALQARWYDQAGQWSGQGRRVARDNLHLTLAFAGAADVTARECLQAMADGIRAAPFILVMDQLGYWPRSQVLWLGCSVVPPSLAQLAHQLNAGLADCGLGPDTRPCRPHLTIARKVCSPDTAAVSEPLVWRVERFVLVRAQTFSDGVRYRVLHTWPLTG